jgi:hypothetical protein
VYNHLRKWRQKWSRVSKLKELSGALWDSETQAIILDQDHYLGHYKVDQWFIVIPPLSILTSLVYPHLSLSTNMQDHPKDAEFLNCPIRFYGEMEAIFGHSIATGRYRCPTGHAVSARVVPPRAAVPDGPCLWRARAWPLAQGTTCGPSGRPESTACPACRGRPESSGLGES